MKNPIAAVFFFVIFFFLPSILRTPRINLTLQGNKVLSGPVLVDGDENLTDISRYESDILDTDNTQTLL